VREVAALFCDALLLALVVELERVEYVPTAAPLSVVAPLRLYDERDEALLDDERDETLSTRLIDDERELTELVEFAERELTELVEFAERDETELTEFAERDDIPDERDEALRLDSEEVCP
jgi:hypothetical protein